MTQSFTEQEQVQQRNKKKKQYIIALVILFAGIALFALLSSMKKPPEQKPVVDNSPIVTVEKITVEDKTLTVSSYGVIQPKYQIALTAQVSGVIVELSDVFVRGGFVKKGQLLARIDPSDYQAALLDAESMVASAEASLQTEQAQGKVAEQEWQEITDAAPTTLSLRKPQLAQEQAKLKAAKAALMRAKRNLERSEIRAPFDAIIEERKIGLGSFVSVGANLGSVLNNEVAQVRLPVPDKEMQFLVNGGVGATVTLEGTVANKTLQWQAQIVRNEGVIDNSNRMHYLVAEINNPYALSPNNSVTHEQAPSQNKSVVQPLRFGAYVKASIQGLHIENTVTIPRQYLINNQVPVLTENSTLALLPIDVLRQEGANIIIINSQVDALNLNGKQLIITSIEQAVDGMSIRLASDISAPTTNNVSSGK